MALGIRGANPIWSEVNLTGKLFDDTYYMWVLENQIPYIPATVYQDPDLNTPWSDPIQFLGNGTLPNNIYFESEVVYRLEFRQHIGLGSPSQSDPLIYLVENYIAGEGGSSPVDTVALTTDNQITNPQFAIVNFTSPYTLSGTNPLPILISPEWNLIATGTGSVTINQVPLTSTTPTTSNAPYALRLTLSGWTTGSVYLVQRFYENGNLWSGKYVASAITASVNGANNTIEISLVDSNGTPTVILPTTTINETLTEFTGYGLLNPPSNPNTPPAAYIDYKISIPSNIDIYLTSIQATVQDIAITPSFIQDSINRQKDYTFHSYMDTIFFKPIPSLLTAWDFPFNPKQFGITSFGTTPIYVWDQTICGSVVGTVNVGRLTTTDAMQFTTTNDAESFFMLQYLTGSEAVKTTLSILSVWIDAYSLVHPGVIVQAFLYYSSAAGTIPPLSGSPATIGTLAANGVFTLNGTTGANWTAIPLFNGYTSTGTLTNSIANEPIIFEGFDGESNIGSSAAHNFAIVVTFTVPTSGTTIQVNSIACVPGLIATKPAPQTKDEVLRQCQFYYRSSFPLGTAPASGTFTGNGPNYSLQTGPQSTSTAANIFINFGSQLRAIPVIATYNPGSTGTFIYNFTRSTSYNATSVTNSSTLGFRVTGASPLGSAVNDLIGINWTADARLGKV